MDEERQKRVQAAYADSFKNVAHQKVAIKKSKPKKQSESKVRDACKDLLRLWGCFVWVNRTGMYSPRQGQKIPYGLKGSGDLMGMNPSGRFLEVECKYGKNDQSEAQLFHQAAVERHGGIYVLAYSVDDLERNKQKILRQ